MMTMMAGAIVGPSLPQIAKVFSNVPHSEITTKLIVSGPAIFIAIFSPLAGYIIDRFGRIRLLQISLVLYSAGGCSGFYLEDLYAILIGRVVLGISVAGIITTVLTLIGDYFQGEDRNKYVGLQGAFMGIGGVTFVALAGVLADVNWHYPFLIYLYSLIVLVFVTIYVPEPDIKRISRKKGTKEVTPEYPRKLVFLIYMIVFFGLVFFFLYPIQIPYLLRSFKGVSNTMVGLAVSIATLAGSIISMNYAKIKRRFSFPFMYGITFFLMGIGYFLVSRAGNYWETITALLISGSSTGFLMPTGNLWLISITPVEIRGRLIGRLSTASFLGQFVSPILVQPIISNYSIQTAFYVASLILLVLSLSLFIYCTTIRKQRRKNLLNY